MKFNLNVSQVNFENIKSTQTGQLFYSRIGNTIFTDCDLIIHQPEINGQKAFDVAHCYQYYMRNGRRCIGVNYKVENKNRQIRTVYCDPRKDYEYDLNMAHHLIYLSNLLTEFGNTGQSLVEITKSTPSLVVILPKGGITATYTTPYGKVEINVEIVKGKDSIAGAKIDQGASDIYTSLTTDKLSAVRDSALDETPEGLISIQDGFRINYSPDGVKPFSSITTLTDYRAKGKSWIRERKLTLGDYKATDNVNEIEKLRIPIPEGNPAQSLDPEYKSLALAYRGGEVVRQVDGKSLDEVIASDQKRGRLTKIALMVLAGVVVLGAVGLLVRWRAKRRAGKVVAP